MRILIIEDNLDIQANIADYLERDYTLDFAYRGDQGLSLALANEYDVIVLDVMLPGMDGIDVCKAYKDQAPTPAPILMLTARDTLNDKETGFNAGADDYLVKPFALKELKLRIEALARRPKAKNTNMLSYADIEIAADRSRYQFRDTFHDLHDKEANILRILIKFAPETVTTTTLEHHLWGDEPPTSSALRTHIYNLRKSLKNAGASVTINSDRGKGYCLEAKS